MSSHLWIKNYRSPRRLKILHSFIRKQQMEIKHQGVIILDEGFSTAVNFAILSLHPVYLS